MNAETKHFVRWLLNSHDYDIIQYREKITGAARHVAWQLKFLVSCQFLDLLDDVAAELPGLGHWNETDYEEWNIDPRLTLFAPLLDSVVNRIDFFAAAEMFVAERSAQVA